MLSDINPTCEYLTLKDECIAKKRKHSDEDGGKHYFRSMSKYNIKNSFTERNYALSDRIHGAFKMMPPKLLHTSGSGIIMYMFESSERLGCNFSSITSSINSNNLPHFNTFGVFWKI